MNRILAAVWLLFAASLMHLPSLRGQDASSDPSGELPALLTLYGLGPEHFAKFQDGPSGADELRLVLQTLHQLSRVPANELAAGTNSKIDWTELLSIPASQRGDAFSLEGKLEAVEAIPLPDADAERFERDRVYRCRLRCSNEQVVELYVANLPAALVESPLPQPVAAHALFLKLSGAGAEAVPVFAAARLGWFPDTTLGRWGVDVGLLDQIAQRRRLTEAEAAPFYMLLARVTPLPADAPVDLAITPRSAEPVVELFRSPEQFVGRLISVRGTLRRVAKIKVTDNAVRDRFGLDEYYELEIFSRIDGLKPELNPLVFVFCIRDLPPELHVGDGLGAPVLAQGVFFKLWTFESAYSRELGEGLRQIAPLAIGTDVAVLTEPAAPRRVGGALLAAALGLVGLVGLAVWWMNHSDRRRRKPLELTFEAPPSEDFS